MNNIITPKKLQKLGFVYNKEKEGYGGSYCISPGDEEHPFSKLLIERCEKFIEKAEDSDGEDCEYWSPNRYAMDLKMSDGFIIRILYDGPVYENEDINLFDYSHIEFDTRNQPNHMRTIAEVYNPESMDIVEAMINLYKAGIKGKKNKKI